MSGETEVDQTGYEDGMGGPGAPMPVSTLEVGLPMRFSTWSR